MKMKKILFTIVAAMCCAAVMAAPAKPEPFTHVQSDGTTVTLMMGGGEFNHSLMTLDGLTVGRDMNGDYCYKAAGSLSDVLAHDQGHRGIEETAFISAYRSQMTLGAGRSRLPRREEENPTPQVPTLGTPRIPIILVNYTDVQFVDENPVNTFENQFNLMEYSCLHYFESQSRGQLGTMIYDACTGLPDVDFSNYDNDDDGYVDVVVVLFAGVGEAQAWRTVPESVWPCQWDMQESLDWGCSTVGPFELNGVTIDKYAVFNELEGNNNYSTTIDGVGTFCHEFGHCLGLPDFYSTVGGGIYGMNAWDIMDVGCYLDNAHRPCGYTSYERHFMGWLDLIEPEENTQYFMLPLNTDEGTAVKVTNDANPDEYYLLDYRVKTDWDEFLPAEGIMILHVDYDKTAWDENTPNNNYNHPRMSLIPADNLLSSYSNRYDLWPQGDLDSLTNNSTPPAMVYTGEFMNKPITGMTVADSVASFWYMKSNFKRGDVNRDGEVNIADVTTLIDAILSNQYDLATFDVNSDGEVNVADITALIDMILTK